MTTVRDWLFASAQARHRPPHATDRGIALFVTASTLNRTPHLDSELRRSEFHVLMVDLCGRLDIEILAWVLLPEHYHAVVAPESSEAFHAWITALHRQSASRWNEDDSTPGRQCWYQFWDRSLWTQGDVACRINYVHGNPVKHGYVKHPEDWVWSSYREYLASEHRDEVLQRLDRFPAPLKFAGDDF